MIRHSHKLLLAAVLSGFSAISVGSVEAGCHGHSSGGYSGGFSRSPSHSYQPSYSQPVYSQPVYSQPVYRQPVYSQPTYPQPVYQQPVYSQPGYGQPQPVYGQQQPQTFPQSQPLQQTQYQAQPQTLQQPQMQGGVAMNRTAINGNLSNGQQQLQQPQQQVQPQQLQAGSAQGSAPQTFAQQNPTPAVAAPVLSPALAVPNGNAATNAPPANDATQSALQALGGFAPPQNAAVQSTVEVPQASQPTFTGSWTASLSNGARVQLSLQADGNFSWVAVNKDGQSSSFQGTYSMENGSLSLSRSTDGQKLIGSMTPSGVNNFSFKLSDAQASSLDFVRG